MPSRTRLAWMYWFLRRLCRARCWTTANDTGISPQTECILLLVKMVSKMGVAWAPWAPSVRDYQVDKRLRPRTQAALHKSQAGRCQKICNRCSLRGRLAQ